ncbi:MAG: 8-amino-7-oxononanoate synthase [Methanosarcinales archaeon]|nr:MAG: 8-amino-7-oxononanoate synthase [Methanosarcinales archaeon]
MKWLIDELKRIKREHLYRKLRILETGQVSRVRVGGRQLLMLSSNNYLGLTEHPLVKMATVDAVKKYGTGSGGSRLVTGTNDLYISLEKTLADFKGVERCLVFSAGYLANIACLTSLMKKGDVILSDSLNHASIIDGCRLSDADVKVYAHRNMEHLRCLLKESTQYRHRLIVTDGLFSMDGDLAPLPEIVELAEDFDALVMVDDAHATGVFGKKRSGTVEYFGMHDKIDIQMGTLSKALGSMGGYVAGREELIEYLINIARSFIFTTALPPAAVGAAIAAINVVQQEDPAKKLWKNVREYTTSLNNGGLSLATNSQIIPILIGETVCSTYGKKAGALIRNEDVTCAVAERLFERGLYVTAIRPPSVPKGKERIRTTLMSTHSRQDVHTAADIILETLGEYGLL